MRNILFFPNRLGQKLTGFSHTVNILNKNIINPKKNIKLYNNQDINLYNLHNINYNIKPPKIIIGGDHSLSIATISSSLKLYPNLKVLWIDAHPDINTTKSSLTKNMHGMPLAFLTKLDNRQFLFDIPKLDFDNIMYIGIRDIDKYEKYIINKQNINVLKCENINNNCNESLHKINNFVKDDPIYISFDVDSIDPNYIYSTGTKKEYGLNPYKIKYIIDNLHNKNIINMDIVELNLTIGNEKQIYDSYYYFSTVFDNYIKFV